MASAARRAVSLRSRASAASSTGALSRATEATAAGVSVAPSRITESPVTGHDTMHRHVEQGHGPPEHRSGDVQHGHAAQLPPRAALVRMRVNHQVGLVAVYRL